MNKFKLQQYTICGRCEKVPQVLLVPLVLLVPQVLQNMMLLVLLVLQVLLVLVRSAARHRIILVMESSSCLHCLLAD